MKTYSKTLVNYLNNVCGIHITPQGDCTNIPYSWLGEMLLKAHDQCVNPVVREEIAEFYNTMIWRQSRR